LEGSFLATQRRYGMPLTENENHSIPLNEASKMTANYRTSAPTGAPLGGFFGKNALQQMLNQQNCIGMRYYYGEKDDGTPVLVLVGVDTNGNDLVEGAILEWSNPCPPFCGNSNALNS
jgi:hypothetical protein